jgi:hypothetical protein
MSATGAQAAVVLVINGHLGTGFSMQTTDESLQHKLPDALEHMAREIRESLKQAKGGKDDVRKPH